MTVSGIPPSILEAAARKSLALNLRLQSATGEERPQLAENLEAADRVIRRAAPEGMELTKQAIQLRIQHLESSIIENQTLLNLLPPHLSQAKVQPTALPLRTIPGAVRWRSKTGGNIDSLGSISSDGCFLFGTTSRTLGEKGISKHQEILALDALTGEVRWESDMGPGKTTGRFDSPDMRPQAHPSGQMAFCVSRDYELCAFSQASGIILWKSETNGDIEAIKGISPDGRIFAGTYHRDKIYALYALDGNTGEILWQSAEAYERIISCKGETIIAYFLKPEEYYNEWRDREERETVALNASDGAVLWRSSSPQHSDIRASSSDGSVIYGFAGNKIYASDARSGKLRWKSAVDSTSVVSSVQGVSADGTSVLAHGQHGFYLRDARSGEIRWRSDDKIFQISPDSGRVLALTEDGEMKAFDLRTGEICWKSETGGRLRQPKENFQPFLISSDSQTAFVKGNDGEIYALSIYGHG